MYDIEKEFLKLCEVETSDNIIAMTLTDNLIIASLLGSSLAAIQVGRSTLEVLAT